MRAMADTGLEKATATLTATRATSRITLVDAAHFTRFPDKNDSKRGPRGRILFRH